jgi:hypothetical protein
MKRSSLMSALVLVLASTVAGCGGGSVAVSGDAPKDGDSAKKDDTGSSDDPVADLQNTSDGLQKQVDTVLQPIKDSDAVLDSLAALPKDLKTSLKSKVDPKKLMAEVKKIFAGKVPDIDSLNFDPDVKAKVQDRVDKVKALYDAVTNLDTAIKDLGSKIADAATSLPAAGTKALGKIELTLKNPLAGGDAKKKATDDKAKIQAIIDGFKTKVTGWQKDMTDIPVKAKDIPKKWAKFAQ